MHYIYTCICVYICVLLDRYFINIDLYLCNYLHTFIYALVCTLTGDENNGICSHFQYCAQMGSVDK